MNKKNNQLYGVSKKKSQVIELTQQIRKQLEEFDEWGNRCKCKDSEYFEFKVQRGTEKICLTCGGYKGVEPQNIGDYKFEVVWVRGRKGGEYDKVFDKGSTNLNLVDAKNYVCNVMQKDFSDLRWNSISWVEKPTEIAVDYYGGIIACIIKEKIK